MYNERKSGCDFVNSAHKDTKFSAVVQKSLVFIMYKQNYKPLNMVPCGIVQTRISAISLLINWPHLLCNQFRHTTSHDLKVL